MDRRGSLKLCGGALAAGPVAACLQDLGAVATPEAPTGPDALEPPVPPDLPLPGPDALATYGGGSAEGSPAPTQVIEIPEGFVVRLSDSGCMGHDHYIEVAAGIYEGTDPIEYASHHVFAFTPAQLRALSEGAREPFSSIRDTEGHGHCGLALRVEEPAKFHDPHPLIPDQPACTPASGARCTW